MSSTERRGRSGCLWAVVALQFVAIVMLVLVAAGLATVGGMHKAWVAAEKMGEDDFPELTETWSTGNGALKVVRIDLGGSIFLGEDTGMFGGRGAADLALAAIRRATNDPEVMGIILDIDSPGGGITASDVLHDALLEFKANGKDRCIVAVFGDMAASGGYYVAAAADSIVARPTSVTGSIGVLMKSVNIQELAQKIGVRDVTIKSGKNKDMLNPFEAIDEDQKAMLQIVIDEMHSRFVKIVAEGRNLPEDDVRLLADGRIFTAGQAMELGLVDHVGYWRKAKAVACERLGVDDVRVVRYEEPFSFSSFFKANSQWDPIGALSRDLPRARLLYQWQP